MNLIEELGIEKCRAIVDGAPDKTASYYMYGTYFKSQNPVEWFYWEQGQWKFTSYSKRFEGFLINLNDIRTAIAEHDNHWYGRSEAEEIKAYAELSQEKIQGGAVLVGNFTVIQQQLQSEINNCSEKDSSEISITDHCTDNLSHFTDNCTDIRNHISPNTKVIER